MTFQHIILAAGKERGGADSFDRCKFQINQHLTLMDLAIQNSEGSQKTCIALDPEDHKFFSDRNLPENIIFVKVLNQTKGALASAALCLDELSESLPIVISAVDGICPGLILPFLEQMRLENSDGGAIVFDSRNPNFSYVRMGSSKPIEFAEKRLVGNLASSGIYYFKDKSLLIESIIWSILNEVMYEGTYYFSGAMNKLIYEDRKVSLFKINESDYYRFSTEKEAFDSSERLKRSV